MAQLGSAVPGIGDALVIVDVQRDFLTGGALPVPDAGAVVPVLNRYIAHALLGHVPVIATRDWHPPDHCSFQARGGPWPAHCVAGSDGAHFASGLSFPLNTITISKGTQATAEAYSAFAGTGLAVMLRALGVRRLWVGGLATDFCVLNTVLDARKAGFEVVLLVDACRAVDAGAGEAAIELMRSAGAAMVRERQVPA